MPKKIVSTGKGGIWGGKAAENGNGAFRMEYK